jgi:hypothetical protein
MLTFELLYVYCELIYMMDCTASTAAATGSKATAGTSSTATSSTGTFMLIEAFVLLLVLFVTVGTSIVDSSSVSDFLSYCDATDV